MDARPRDWTRAARVAGTFLVVSVGWIFLSDRALAAAGLAPDHLHWVQTAKGTAFVVLTAGLLYWLVGREVRAAARASDLLRGVVDGTADGVFVKDRNGRYLLCNPAAAGFFGRRPDEVLGRTDADFLGPADAERVRADDRRVMETGQADSFEEPVTLAGEVRTLQVTKAPYRDAAGAVVGVLGVGRDVTDRKRLEAQFLQAQKMEAVGRLASGIAHDFNNVLTAINGCGELLQAMPLPEPAGELVDDLRSAGERAVGLTRQLLALGRPSPATPQVLDPNALVRDVERLLRRVIGAGIDLTVRLRPGVGSVFADSGQLEQVLLNLAVNARDAMPGGGGMTIETEEADFAEEAGVPMGRYVRVSVSDTGAGIPPDVLPHIFEPFYTTKGEGYGTGLGLATVHGIVRQAGGHVELVSTVGTGTTFIVYLPRVDGPLSPEAPPSG